MFKTLLIYINIVFAALLLIAGFSSFVNPQDFWPTAFLGLGYPFILCINLLLIVLWFLFFKAKKYALISIIAIVFTWFSFGSIFSISAPARSADDVSIMTWNVKNFDLYNWSKNKETHELMMLLLEEQNPDILCLQEFYTETKGNFKNIKEIKKRLGYKYHYFGQTFSVNKNKNKWGLITFSKFPIKDSGLIDFNMGNKLNAAIYTDIAYEKDSLLRVYNIHLQSLHFADEDYKYLNDLKEEQKPDVESSLKIVKKIRNGFVKRSSQAQLIKTHSDSFKGKQIICGDFNDTFTSYSYKTLSEGFQDAFLEKGIGFGNTLVNPSPFFRIDFVLVDESIDINNYKTFKKNYSDHYPIKVHLELKPKLD